MAKVSLWYLGISYVETYSGSDNSVPSVVTCQHVYQKILLGLVLSSYLLDQYNHDPVK